MPTLKTATRSVGVLARKKQKIRALMTSALEVVELVGI
jgi:hypothetical protein